PFLSSFLDAWFVRLNGWGSQPYWEIWRMRFSSNAAAAITIVPAIVSLGSIDLNSLRKAGLRRRGEAILLGASVVTVVYSVFYLNENPTNTTALWLLYVPLPFFIWAAVRFGVGV